MASTRISLIVGPEGPEGPEGPAGPNTVPADEAIGAAIETDGTAANLAVTANIETAIETVGLSATPDQVQALAVRASRLDRPAPLMPAVRWLTSFSSAGYTNNASLKLDGTVVLDTPLKARLVNAVASNIQIDQTYWRLMNGSNGSGTGSPLVREAVYTADVVVMEFSGVVSDAANQPGGVEMWIDGAPLYIPPAPVVSSNVGIFLELKWPTKAPRKITHSTYLCSQSNTYVLTGDTVVATAAPGTSRLLVVGDSWAEGTGQGPVSFARLLGRYLGIEDAALAAQGGTGYINAGPAGQGKSVYGSTNRMEAVVRHAPSDLVVWGSINDKIAGTAAATGAAAAAYYAYMATNLPTTRLHVVLPQTVNPTEDALQAPYRAAVLAAAQAAPKVVSITDTLGWLTGTGKTTDRKGDGNRDLYMSGIDGHPSPAGHHFIASRLADVLRRWVY